MRFSLDYISVPPDHRPGAIELPAIGGPNPDHHFTLSQHSQLDEDEFREQIAAHVSGRVGSIRDVLIYVHGFNTSLEEARFRLAQLVVDAKFGGVAVLFTWPSKAALLAYGADKESATASRDAYLKSAERSGGYARDRTHPHPRPFHGHVADDGDTARRGARRTRPISTASSEM